MKMNVQPIPTLSERINEIRSSTAEIVNKEILPHENELWGWRSNGDVAEGGRAQARGLREQIKARVREAGSRGPHGLKE